VAQEIKHLLNWCEALSSNPPTAKRKRKLKEKDFDSNDYP
jgi:hypothetical protein